jgi:hypothetical protein
MVCGEKASSMPLLPWREKVAEGRMRGNGQSWTMIKPLVPLTLTLSLQGRGDKAVFEREINLLV